MPASSPSRHRSFFGTTVALEVRPGLHRLLSGVSARVLRMLVEAAESRLAFMQPALARDKEAAAGFSTAGPQLVRTGLDRVRRITGRPADRVNPSAQTCRHRRLGV